MQVDDIPAEAHQHLGSHFPADAAPGEVVVGKERLVLLVPAIRDGIPHEHGLRSLHDSRIGLCIAAEMGPVVIGKVLRKDRSKEQDGRQGGKDGFLHGKYGFVFHKDNTFFPSARIIDDESYQDNLGDLPYISLRFFSKTEIHRQTGEPFFDTGNGKCSDGETKSSHRRSMACL